jgi:hypothetical protein
LGIIRYVFKRKRNLHGLKYIYIICIIFVFHLHVPVAASGLRSKVPWSIARPRS